MNLLSASPDAAALRRAIESYARLEQAGERVLGTRGWSLFRSYGRTMSGPHSGHYMSGVPERVVMAFLEALAAGEAVPVHLMHRHVSGNYESSRLAIRGGRLWMLFPNRSELALNQREGPGTRRRTAAAGSACERQSDSSSDGASR